MKKQKAGSYGLILSSIVAVVAMVGLVMLFGNHLTGAYITNPNLACNGQWGVYQYINEEGRLDTSNIVCMEHGTVQSLWPYRTENLPGPTWTTDEVAWQAPEAFKGEPNVGEIRYPETAIRSDEVKISQRAYW